MAQPTLSKGEASRQAILRAAYRLFLEQGYHATSVRDISRASGLTTGGVYTHFAGKEAIFTAVLEEHHPFLQIPSAMAAAQGDTIDAVFHDMARRMVAALGTQREALNLIFIEVVEFQGQHFAEMFPTFFPLVAERIERAIHKQGSPRPIPTPTLVRSFFGLIFSYFMSNIALSNRLATDEQSLNEFVDIYLYGILAETKTSQGS